MYTDKCSIQNILNGTQFGDETILDTQNNVLCRVEGEDLAENSNSGTRNVHKRLYILPPGTVISNGDKIKTVIQRGVIITEDYFKVDQVFKVGGLAPHHLEVSILNV